MNGGDLQSRKIDVSPKKVNHMRRSRSVDKYKQYLKGRKNVKAGPSAERAGENIRIQVINKSPSKRRKHKADRSPNFFYITEAMNKSDSKTNKDGRNPAPTPAPAPTPPQQTLGEGQSTTKGTKRPFRRSLKRHTKRNRKRNSKRNMGRQVRVDRSKILTEEDIKRMEKKIAEIRKVPPSAMKKALEEIDVKTTGKSNRLLKDIYLYSKICNVNFQHEK